MFKFIVGAVVMLVAAILILAATNPDTFRVQRSVSVKAAPDAIFALVDNFHSWNTWSPYENKDPAMSRTFGGADEGKGAVYEWNGNSKVGAGRMEITESSPFSKITIKLDFIKPFEGHNIAEFTFAPQGDSTTTVSWAMEGPCPYVAKVMGVFFNMDHMIGGDFEVGLANLKKLTEK